MKRIIFAIIFVLIVLLLEHSDVLALDQQTHGAINEIVATGNVNSFSLNAYLTNNLGIEQGTEASFNGTKVYRWVRLGGEYEDDRPLPYLRSFNHFHDPTKSSLDQAGLNTYWHGIRLTGVSSILWSLSKDIQKNAYWGLLGDYSWPATRDYFYQALTATDETTRTNNYVNLFRGIGQLMHLVEDASVPEHTRNEAHILNWNYETWVQKNENSTNISDNSFIVNSILNGTPIIPYSTVLAQQGNTDTRIGGLPISRLFDTYNFNGQNPDVTTNADIGLAEFTNANFFSEKTAGQNNNYNFPSNASLYKFSQTIQDPRGQGNITRYFYGKSGNGVAVNHLAARCYFDYEYEQYNRWQDYNNGPIFLDETCYKDYATLLLPRAEGYAFSLMQYFFRGQVEAAGATTITGFSGEITGMTLKAKNRTPKIGGSPDEKENIGGDPIDNNTLTVAYQYKQGSDTVYGKSNSVTFNTYAGYQYQFNFTQSIPTTAEDKRFLLVYRGKLGDEYDAVAAKSFEAPPPSSITEITNWVVVDGGWIDPQGANGNFGLKHQDANGNGILVQGPCLVNFIGEAEMDFFNYQPTCNFGARLLVDGEVVDQTKFGVDVEREQLDWLEYDNQPLIMNHLILDKQPHRIEVQPIIEGASEYWGWPHDEFIYAAIQVIGLGNLGAKIYRNDQQMVLPDYEETTLFSSDVRTPFYSAVGMNARCGDTTAPYPELGCDNEFLMGLSLDGQLVYPGSYGGDFLLHKQVLTSTDHLLLNTSASHYNKASDSESHNIQFSVVPTVGNPEGMTIEPKNAFLALLYYTDNADSSTVPLGERYRQRTDGTTISNVKKNTLLTFSGTYTLPAEIQIVADGQVIGHAVEEKNGYKSISCLSCSVLTDADYQSVGISETQGAQVYNPKLIAILLDGQ